MSRAGTLRRWTICTATLLLAGGTLARAQTPAKAPGAPPQGLVTAAELDAARASGDTSHVKRAAATRKHRLRLDDIAGVTALTAALGTIVEPATRIAPEPIAVADATTWPTSLASGGRAGASADGKSLANDVARVLASDSVRAAALTPIATASGDTTKQGRANAAGHPAARATPAPPVLGTPATPAPSMTVALATAAPAGSATPATPAASAPALATAVPAVTNPAASASAGAAAATPGTAAPVASAATAISASPPAAVPAAVAPAGTASDARAAARVGTAAAAAPAVLGQPVTGFAPDATRVAAPAGGSFVREQLTSARVIVARGSADVVLRSSFEHAGVPYPGAVYLRAFKREHELEVWGRKADGTYALVRTYSICSLGGSALGPKLHRGDEQVPEGFYHVIEFNPSSEYHLSLRLDYPNAADRARKGADDLGGDIYLHGGCKSAGCLPLTDQGIEQVYWLAVQARGSGQHQIPIDIFPARLDAAHWSQLSQAFARRPDLLAFWSDLKLGFDAFEQTHRLPDVAIDATGRYRIALTR